MLIDFMFVLLLTNQLNIDYFHLLEKGKPIQKVQYKNQLIENKEYMLHEWLNEET